MSRFVRFAPSFERKVAVARNHEEDEVDAFAQEEDQFDTFPAAMLEAHAAAFATDDVPSVSSFEVRKVNTAIAASDGPSLSAALAQSIRHHARMIDGDQQSLNKQEAGAPAPSFVDPYEEDDHVSLAPAVELNYEKDAPPLAPEASVLAPALRPYVANAGVDVDAAKDDAREASGLDRTVAQQQERLDERLQGAGGARGKKNLSTWFRAGAADAASARSRAVRFAVDDDPAAAAAAVANGEVLPEAAAGRGGRTSCVIPATAAFRTATRHPSHLPSEMFDNLESRLAAPRRILAARKRHRRNDSFLRLTVAILCFGLSLAFASLYGQGQLGLAVTTMAYERKIRGRYDDFDPSSRKIPLNDIFYPDWWGGEQGIPDMESKSIELATTLEYNAADVVKERAPGRIETPYLWFVPRSGGNVVRTIISMCLRLAEASEYGLGSESAFLRVAEEDDRKFVNVDMFSSKGIAHAKKLNLAESGVPDVIISGDLHRVLDIFNNRNRARLFVVLRHPLERAISKYYADLTSDPDVAGMSLPMYVRSGGQRVENNYLTRHLAGRYDGTLTLRHLNVARELLRRKFVVGLASDLPATTTVFSHVFGWNHTVESLGSENVNLCYNEIFDALSKKPPPSVEEGSEGWRLLVAQNWFDLKIYEYAEHLFQLQMDQLPADVKM